MVGRLNFLLKWSLFWGHVDFLATNTKTTITPILQSTNADL